MNKICKMTLGVLLSCSILIAGIPGIAGNKAQAAEPKKAMMTKTQGIDLLRQDKKSGIADIVEYSNTYVKLEQEQTVKPPVLVPSKAYFIDNFRQYDRAKKASFMTLKAADGTMEQIKPTDIAFISAAEGSKKNRVVEFQPGHDLTPVEMTNTTNWKLTIKNPYHEKKNPNGIKLPDISNVHFDYNCVIFDYKNLYSTGNSYLSAVVLTRGEGEVVAYDRIVDASKCGVGTAIIHWPEEYDKNMYVLKVFAETYNGDHMTDYISDMRLVYRGVKISDDEK